MRKLTISEERLIVGETIKQITRSVVTAKGYESKICSDDKNAIMEIVAILKSDIFKDNKYVKILFDNPNCTEFNSIEGFLNITEISVPFIHDYCINEIYQEIELSYKRLFEWKNSINKNSGLKVEDTIKKLQLENQKLKKEIEYLKKNLPKRKTFSSSQIQAIKNMNTKGISIKLIAIEFNCKVEDIQNIIDNI